MLRQALDAADRQKEAEEAAAAEADAAEQTTASSAVRRASSRSTAASPDETTPALSSAATATSIEEGRILPAAAGTGTSATAATSYGSIPKEEGEAATVNDAVEDDNGETGESDEEEEEESGEDDDEEESLLDDDDDDDEEWDDDDDEREEVKRWLPFICGRLWNVVKSAFLIVANVENLWDTPPPELSDAQNAARYRRRRNSIVLFWFVVLAASYATERSTFKLLVDRTGPFRLFAVEMVTATHCLMLVGGWLAAVWMKENSRISLGISIVDVGLMALLDTVALLLVFLTGVHVPPSLTVILIQFTLPLTAFLTQFVHPDGRCSCSAVASQQQHQSMSRQEQQQQQSSPTADNGYHAVAATTNAITSSNHSPPRYGGTTGDGGGGENDDDDDDDPYGNGHRHHRPGAGRGGRGGDAAVAAPVVEEGQPLRRAGGLSAEHVWGSLIIFLACLLALLPAFYSIADPDFFVYADTIPIRTAYNTLLYVSSCVPAAASQLYKEHVFLQYRQPVNGTYLNILLSLFQFGFASIMSPLVFSLQGLGVSSKRSGQDWTELYPSSKFSENYLDGLKCFFGLLPDADQESKYFDDARCDFVLGLTVFHALSIIAVGVAVDKIVNAGATKVMYRGVSAGVIIAVLCMHEYDLRIPEFSYGPIIDSLNLACLILLIFGSEVYHRVALQDISFETVFPTIETYYEDDA